MPQQTPLTASTRGTVSMTAALAVPNTPLTAGARVTVTMVAATR